MRWQIAFAAFVMKIENCVRLRLFVCFVLLFWYGITSPSILFKLFGEDLCKVANSVLFPVGAISVWVAIICDSGLKWPSSLRLFNTFKARIIGLDKEFEDFDQVEEASRKI